MQNETIAMGFNSGSLDQAQELVRQLEAGNYEAAQNVMQELYGNRENSLFQDIGKLTRELHETLNSFDNDSDLKKLTHENMPNVRERLDYVIKTTEQSTHRTLDAIENCMPKVHELGERAGLLKKKMTDVEASSVDSKEMDEYLLQVESDTKTIYSSLSEVLMAQGFQDITGQVLQRVVKLVQEVEQSLVSMLCLTNENVSGDINEQPRHDNKGYGPSVPGVTQGNVLKNQGDVDDLLSTLGF